MTTLATSYRMEPGELKKFDSDRVDSHRRKIIDSRQTYRVVACKQVAAGLYHIDFEQVKKGAK